MLKKLSHKISRVNGWQWTIKLCIVLTVIWHVMHGSYIPLVPKSSLHISKINFLQPEDYEKRWLRCNCTMAFIFDLEDQGHIYVPHHWLCGCKSQGPLPTPNCLQNIMIQVHFHYNPRYWLGRSRSLFVSHGRLCVHMPKYFLPPTICKIL